MFLVPRLRFGGSGDRRPDARVSLLCAVELRTPFLDASVVAVARQSPSAEQREDSLSSRKNVPHSPTRENGPAPLDGRSERTTYMV